MKDYRHGCVKSLKKPLRRNAKIILPPRLYMLSQKHNLPYQSVKINSSSGRWGSCSARRNINLSFYLVLLPKHLIDYVLFTWIVSYSRNEPWRAFLGTSRRTDGRKSPGIAERAETIPHRNIGSSYLLPTYSLLTPYLLLAIEQGEGGEWMRGRWDLVIQWV